jgi:hypothetical protein
MWMLYSGITLQVEILYTIFFTYILLELLENGILENLALLYQSKCSHTEGCKLFLFSKKIA